MVVPPGGGGSTFGASADGLGLAFLTIPPMAGMQQENLTAQQMLFTLFTAPKTAAVSFLGTYVETPGATAGAGVNQMGLYSEAGVLLTSTGDMTAAWDTAEQWAEAACTPSVVLTGGANYYFGIVANFTGTKLGIPGNGNISYQALNGHFMGLFLNGQATLPASFTPGSAGAGFAACLGYGR